MIEKVKKIFILAVLFIYAFNFYSCVGKSGKSTIEFSLEAGEEYSVLISREIKNLEEFNGVISEIQQKTETGYTFTPKRISEDGETLLIGAIESINLIQRSEFGEILFDSRKDDSEFSIFAKPFAKLIGKQFDIVVLKDGSVASVSGMNKIIDDAALQFELSDVKFNAYLKEIMYEQFADEVLKENFERMLAFYPSKEVEAGDVWQRTSFLTNQIPLVVNNKYTLLERNNGAAIIRVESNIKTDSSKIRSESGKFYNQILEGTQHGKMQIDEITGWISKAAFTCQIHEVSYLQDETNKPRILSSEIKIKYEPLAGDVFRKVSFDPKAALKGDGIGMTIVGMSVVFSSLIVLYFVFMNLSKLISFFSRDKSRSKIEKENKESTQQPLTGEVNAAIAAALYLYSQEMHDQESAVLTIKKASRFYSPWSSKIHGLRRNPR